MLFRYLAARWRYRDPRFKRYVRAGLGLENRAHRLYTFWSEHLSRSRAAQARWARECGGGTLTVLGAGPLFDFNDGAFSGCFERFRLVDANPLSEKYWRRLSTPVEPVITDISNCLDEWANEVTRLARSWEETLGVIRGLGSEPACAYNRQTDALLSLNILSQLDVGWQELLEPMLQKRFGRRFVAKREQDWLGAVRPSSRRLVEQHLAAIEASAASNVLLISDVEYLEYTGRTYSRMRWAEPPLRWTEQGWQAETGIQYSATPALEGVELNDAGFAIWMPSYQLNWQETWLWHLAPNGTESTNHGMIHRVAAFSLRLKR